ncbi:MAG TPA: glycosyltransferase family 4 protein [Vicinamibacterales bacterium]|jgi:glycosyltransferase involved in cell wall biosynthesis|nr:glycosyltransferase family 4 protein [Vicinamibacterales bacterium]
MFSLHIDTQRDWRGGQRQVLLTVLGLRERGHRAVLLAHPEGELAKRASEGHDLLKLAPRTEVDLHAGWRLSRIIRELKPDLVHAHDPHAVAAAALALAFNTSSEGPGLIASRRVAFHLKPNAFSRWKYRQVDCFIAASASIHATLLNDGIEPSKIATVYEGIDVHRIQAEPRASIHAELWLPTNAPIVGATGALTAEKGHRHLIDAAALVVRDVPDARFVILGEGELRPSLERQVRELHLDKHVLLPGFRADVLAFLRAFDVFVMPSIAEGLGTSLLDAMAASKATVATRTGGIPEVVVDEETGLLVPPRDHLALASAISRLLKDGNLRERMGQAGLARVEKLFSADRMVDQTLDVYRAHARHHGEAGGKIPLAGRLRPPSRG